MTASESHGERLVPRTTNAAVSDPHGGVQRAHGLDATGTLSTECATGVECWHPGCGCRCHTAERAAARQVEVPAEFLRWFTASSKGAAGHAWQVATVRAAAEHRRLRAEYVDALTRGAYADGLGDGQRKATAGMKREWAVQDGGEVYPEIDEASARRLAAGWDGDVTVVSRLACAWEPAEQRVPAEGGDHGDR